MCQVCEGGELSTVVALGVRYRLLPPALSACGEGGMCGSYYTGEGRGVEGVVVAMILQRIPC